MSTYESAFCNATTDLEFVIPDIQQFDRKILITGWLPHQSNVYKAGSTGTVDTMFRDQFELASAQSSLSNLISSGSDGDWFYDSSTDISYLLSSNNPLTHHTIEGGRDYATLKSQAINRAAEFIRSYIDKPIYKRTGTGVQSVTARDYEDVIVRSNAILACTFLLMPYDPERAREIEKMAYDKEEAMGYLDQIKRGEIRLWHEVDKRRGEGVVTEVSVNSSTTGSIIDVRGKASATDLIKVIITTGGTFAAGTASPVKYSTYIGDDTGLKMKLTETTRIISGQYQNAAHGVEIKFSAGVYVADDEWQIEVVKYSDYPETQLPIKNSQAERR